MSLSIIWAMGTCKVPVNALCMNDEAPQVHVTEPCMNHTPLQDTCHRALYEPWSPTNDLSLSLVQTMGPCQIPVIEPWIKHGTLQTTWHWALYEPCGPCKVPVTETCMNHGALQGTCHWDLYEPWGPTRYLSLRLVWTMGPYKVPSTEMCMNHGAPQGTCHWDLYEPWGPARYLSLRLVWTIGPCKVPVTDTCTSQGALQDNCHWDLCEPWGPARYLSLTPVWTMGPYRVHVTDTCMNHGALQGTCHWYLYEPWGPASYLSLRLVQTMGSCTTIAQEQAPHFWLCQVDHDGGSLSLFLQFHSWVWQWPGFQSQTDFLHHCHVLTNQPTTTTRPTFCTTSKCRIFTKLTVVGISRHYLHLQNPTVHQHTHKTPRSTTPISSQVSTIHSMNSISVILN